MRPNLITTLALICVLGGCKPNGVFQNDSSSTGTGAAWTLQELKPETAPADGSELRLGGTHLPVKIVATNEQGKLTFKMMAHDVVLDTEVYDVQSDKFSLVTMGYETAEPPIPLLKSPMHVGDKWEWEGKINSGNPHATKAVISSRPDKLYIQDKQLDSIVVEVNLSMDSGAPTAAQRRLSFWFVPGRGLVKREFGSGSIRQPAPKD